MNLLSWLRGALTRPPPRQPFLERLEQWLATRSAAEHPQWTALFNHCREATQAAPTGKWTKEAKRLLELIGPQEFCRAACGWFSAEGRADFERSADLVKGLVWCTALVDDEQLSPLVAELAQAAFRKIPQHGPVSVKVGNACFYALGASSSFHAAAQLSRLKTGTRYRQALKMIDKALGNAAEERGLSKDDLEEQSVPRLDRALPQQLGRWSPQLQFSNGSLGVRWLRDDHKISASVPAEVKRDHPEAQAELKKYLAQMNELLPAQAARLEHLFISNRALTLPQWREHYVDHPLVGLLARPLVWTFSSAGDEKVGFWFDGEVLEPTGAKLELDETASVRLWHPLNRSEGEVDALRKMLERIGLEQPFKQLEREVFPLTELELARGVSTRFAQQRIKQQQFAALCRQCGWTYRLMGQFDSFNIPVRVVPQWRLQVELDVEAAEEGGASNAGIFLHLTTGALRFLRTEGTPSLADVPPTVLSELQRDVSLFVQVCAVR
jgi:hypothetical protein